jgi:hypothetical protein
MLAHEPVVLSYTGTAGLLALKPLERPEMLTVALLLPPAAVALA